MKIQTKRLLKLAEFLETKVPKEEFAMKHWCEGKKPGCGTVGCAIGWATTIPSFRKAGFKLYDIGSYAGIPPYYVPIYKNIIKFDAAEVFFGLNQKYTRYIFTKFFYEFDEFNPITPHQVAARIREFVSDNTKP